MRAVRDVPNSSPIQLALRARRRDDVLDPVFSWFIFTYGMLIYTTLGDSAQQQFAKVRS